MWILHTHLRLDERKCVFSTETSGGALCYFLGRVKNVMRKLAEGGVGKKAVKGLLGMRYEMRQ